MAIDPQAWDVSPSWLESPREDKLFALAIVVSVAPRIAASFTAALAAVVSVVSCGGIATDLGSSQAGSETGGRHEPSSVPSGETGGAGSAESSSAMDGTSGVSAGPIGDSGGGALYHCGSVTFGGGCGDGILDPDEECDDGNGAPGDGCNGLCRIEPNFICDGDHCEPILQCGNGWLDSANGEECDDGNTSSGDGCSASCRVEPNWGCPTIGSPCVVVSVCGDATVDSGEACDDGNVVSGDGCSAECDAVEPGFLCVVPGNACMDCNGGECPPGECGDGVVQSERGEVCDLGADNGALGATCSAYCARAPFCGDGIVDAGLGELCDDGTNDTYGYESGCTPACTFAAWCGDGVADTEYGEACDEGSSGNWGMYGGCRSDCQLAPHCGDGIIQRPQESCDDGVNDGSRGTCSNTCEMGPYCGDGVVQFPDELCDDGANEPCDGCSPSCQHETSAL